VLADTRYRADRIGPDDIRAFYATGESEVEVTLGLVRTHIAGDFHPQLSLDYGSGLGRLTIPIARASRQTIGVDISDPMLRESRKNAASMGVANVTFVHAGDFLDAADATYPFDFVHSYIVLQHIAPRVGMRITATLLRRLNRGGVAALHYTFDRRASLLRKIIHRARIALPPLNVLANIAQRRPAFEPMMPMHHYHVPTLFATFREHGAETIHVIPTDHGGHIGAMFIFQKR